MPTYNKGDFTQQGVDGYVDGSLELNQKRIVDVRVSSDEESETISDVNIKIRDELNDLEYDITGSNLATGENVIGGGGGQETVTKTYTIMPAGTYELQLFEGLKIIMWEHEETDELTICAPIAPFNISINNHSFEFHPKPGTIDTTYPYTPLYTTEDIVVPDVGRFNYEAYIGREFTTIEVPRQVIGELTEYTVDTDAEVSVTGKPVTTLPADTENNVIRTSYLAKNNGTYYYYTSNEPESIELPMDILVCAACETAE